MPLLPRKTKTSGFLALSAILGLGILLNAYAGKNDLEDAPMILPETQSLIDSLELKEEPISARPQSPLEILASDIRKENSAATVMEMNNTDEMFMPFSVSAQGR